MLDGSEAEGVGVDVGSVVGVGVPVGVAVGVAVGAVVGVPVGAVVQLLTANANPNNVTDRTVNQVMLRLRRKIALPWLS